MHLDTKHYTTGIFKAKDNSQIPEDEWIVFNPQDSAFAAVLPLYLEQCIAMEADEEQIAAVILLIERVDKWREAHPDRCKVPDAAGERMLEP